MAEAFHPNNQYFYRCDCEWRGNQLLYTGFDIGKIKHPLAYRFRYGQGVCPNCNRPFVGVLHPTIIKVIMKEAQDG